MRRSPMRTPTLILACVLLASCGGDVGGDVTAMVGHHGAHPSSGGMGPDPVPVRLGPQGRHPQFVVTCLHSHSLTDDPIVWAGVPGASHLHEFFGSRETDAMSTGESLVDTSTTCENTADTAAYWVPALFDGDERVQPDRLVAYYRTGVGFDPRDVAVWPDGLKMLAGDPGAARDQSLGVVGWTCGSSDHVTVLPRECSPRAPLTLRLVFPDCWDGRNIDSDDHRSHVGHSVDGRCPDATEIPIVQLILAVRYHWWGDPSGLRLASGHIRTGHGDVLNGWSRGELDRLTRLCLERGQICGISSNRTDLSS